MFPSTRETPSTCRADSYRVIQLNILTGKKAGTQWVTRRFPVRIGRAADNDLQLEENGVWDRHCQLAFQPGQGFALISESAAITSINGRPTSQSVLGNGDLIEFGSVKIKFWLGQTRQRGLRWREWLTWAAIAGISLIQIGLIYWLLRQ